MTYSLLWIKMMTCTRCTLVRNEDVDVDPILLSTGRSAFHWLGGGMIFASPPPNSEICITIPGGTVTPWGIISRGMVSCSESGRHINSIFSYNSNYSSLESNHSLCCSLGRGSRTHLSLSKEFYMVLSKKETACFQYCSAKHLCILYVTLISKDRKMG